MFTGCFLRSTHRLGAVVEVNHAVAEASFGQQIEL
jgi:hypothetical protein